MSDFIPWNSQPLDAWAGKFAQGEFINLDGHTTHYIEKGDGEPVIFLHGFNFDSYLWVANIDFLAEKFKIYALDLWGFGYSSREPMDYGYQLYADQLLKFMDTMGIQSASLVGQSMGGGTAILFSTQHRERVKKLILVDPAGMPEPLPLIGKILNLPKVGELVLGLKTDAIRKKNLRDLWFYNNDLVTDDFFENASRYQKIVGTTEAGMAILRKRFFGTLSNEVHSLAQTDIPILIVFGREDKGVSVECGAEMHEICAGSRLEIIDKAGHAPNYEKSEMFNQMAMDFLAS